MAGHGPGYLVSLLPDEVFPFAYGPVGDVRDRDSIIKQDDPAASRAGPPRNPLPNVKAQRTIAVVGHDYGGVDASIIRERSTATACGPRVVAWPPTRPG